MKHECTITLRPLLYSKTATQQFEIVAPIIKDIFRPYKSSIIAELTGEHNVHFHALLEIEGAPAKDTFLNRFRGYNKYFGRKTCTAVQYETSYEKYLCKDYQTTSKILNNPVVKDDYKLFIGPSIMDYYEKEGV